MRSKSGKNLEALYAATEQWVETCLKQDGSLFTPGKPVWTGEVLADFYQRFVEHPDTSSKKFNEKLELQLKGAPDSTFQLAGECLFVYYLVPERVKLTTKLNGIQSVLGWSSKPVEVPASLMNALESGIVLRGGAGYNTYKPFHIQYLIELAMRLREIPPGERSATLSDPWAFRELAYSVSVKGSRPMREGVLHFVHPEVFEPIVAYQAKRRFVEHFSALVPSGDLNLDQKITRIREAMSEKYGRPVGIFDPEILDQWQPESSLWGRFIMWAKRFHELPDFEAKERDYKLLVADNFRNAKKALEEGQSDWLDKLKQAFGSPNNLTFHRTHSLLLTWAEEHPEQAKKALAAVWDSQRDCFERIAGFSEVFPREVLSGRGGRLNLASVLNLVHDPESEPPYRRYPFDAAYELTGQPKVPSPRETPEADHYRHALDFLDLFDEKAGERGLDLQDRLDAQGVLWCLYNWEPEHWDQKTLEALKAYREGLPLEPAGEVSEVVEPTPPYGVSLAQLADELFLTEAFLARSVRLLEDKKQVIFYGPPGTGKTYVARELARHLTQGNDAASELVQFHPSYAYEDFVEGFRPSGGGGGFQLKSGPLKRIAWHASERPEQTHILIIDEINRGNLAKIFGELFFLLEYRKKDITLQYSDQSFSLPENLWVIGTMNTADRSIALVDAALRRRFHFVAFYPDDDPIRELLPRWLAKHRPEMSWVAEVLERANELLGDREIAIGPSHFLREDLDDQWVEDIWEHSILPYLADQLFDESDRLKDFELKRLRKAIAAGEGGDEPEIDEDS